MTTGADAGGPIPPCPSCPVDRRACLREICDVFGGRTGWACMRIGCEIEKHNRETAKITPLVVREGRPFRTDDELSRQFVEDVLSLSLLQGIDMRREAVEIDGDLDVTPLDFGSQAGYEDHVEDCVSDADDLLEDMGFYVVWEDGDDGYRIYRDTEEKS